MDFKALFPIYHPKQKYEICWEKGNRLFKQKKYREAIESFEEGLNELDYSNGRLVYTEYEIIKMIIPLLSNVAACYVELHDFRNTEKYCDQILSFQPDNRRALFFLTIAEVQRSCHEDQLQRAQGLQRE